MADNPTYIDNPNDPDDLTSATDFSAPGNLDDDVLVDNVEPTIGSGGADDPVYTPHPRRDHGSPLRRPDYTGGNSAPYESESSAVTPADSAGEEV